MALSCVVLQFSSEPKLHSALIRWFTNSKFSHVDFVMPDGKLMGARFRGGVQIRPKDYTTFTNIERYAVYTDKADAIYAYAQSKIGTPYDFEALFAFAFNKNWENDNKLFCSNFTAISFKEGGLLSLNPDADVKRITPNDQYLCPFLAAVANDFVPS